MRGSMFLVEGQVFAIASDSVRHVPSFLILNVVATPRIALLDGLLIAASSSLRIPSAYLDHFRTDRRPLRRPCRLTTPMSLP